MPTYQLDPLHPDRLVCDRCGTPVAPVAGKEFPAVESLTAWQVREYFPGAAGEIELHDILCRCAEEGGTV
jgi:hypothetical protein